MTGGTKADTIAGRITTTTKTSGGLGGARPRHS